VLSVRSLRTFFINFSSTRFSFLSPFSGEVSAELLAHLEVRSARRGNTAFAERIGVPVRHLPFFSEDHSLHEFAL
jgi:hypothetical protein